jgi:hypothetical protein
MRNPALGGLASDVLAEEDVALLGSDNSLETAASFFIFGLLPDAANAARFPGSKQESPTRQQLRSSARVARFLINF